MIKSEFVLPFSNTEIEKNWLKSTLATEILNVTFIKKDGSERKMKCTLMEDKIPSEKTPKGSEKSKSDEVLPVFDVESDGWRSFRWDSISSVEIIAD